MLFQAVVLLPCAPDSTCRTRACYSIPAEHHLLLPDDSEKPICSEHAWGYALTWLGAPDRLPKPEIRLDATRAHANRNK